MFNHNSNQNIEVDYDKEDNVCFTLRQDLPAGSPLSLSYGLATNPHRFLVIFGFVDESQPEIFCQILSNEPSEKLVEMGYDSSKMVFRTEDRAISNAVWDVMMYNLLEQVPKIQDAFYKAHKMNDKSTKAAIHSRFHLEAALLLRKHVNNSVSECQQLLEKANGYDSTKHPRLPLIRKHLKFLVETFVKVRHTLDETIQSETASRKQ